MVNNYAVVIDLYFTTYIYLYGIKKVSRRVGGILGGYNLWFSIRKEVDLDQLQPPWLPQFKHL
jgi:hypothetical protein